MYIKNILKQLLKTPLIYFSAILFCIAVNANFYIRHEFFLGKGSSDLLLYFSAIPFICSLLIPCISYNFSFYSYQDFLPLKSYKKIIYTFCANLIIFIGILSITICGALFVNLFGTIDFGQFFASYFCLIFYSSSIIAICIFLNELFENHITGFIISILILLLINTIHLVVAYIPINSIIINIVKKLSFAWHFDAASKGILDSRDLLWYLASTLLFLLLTDYTKHYKSGLCFSNLSGDLKFTFIARLLIVFLVLLNSSQYYLTKDLSKNKNFSLSKYSKELISHVNEPLKITYYRSSKLNQLYPQIKDISDFLSIYSNQNKNISYIVNDTDKNQNTIEMLKNYGISSQQMRNIKTNSVEYLDVYSAIVLEYKGQAQAIPFTLSINSLEYDLSTKLTYLLSNKKRIVNIIVGNDLDLFEDYNYVIPWLSSQGFSCNPISIYDNNFSILLENSTGPLLVIGDSNINIEQAVQIESYILSHKENALFTLSPYSCDIENDWSLRLNNNTNLVDILENWGVSFDDSIAADISCSQITMYSQENEEDYINQNNVRKEVLNYPLWISLLPQNNSKLGSTVFWASPLNLSKNASPYLITSDYSYTYKIDSSIPQKLIETNPFILRQENFSDKVLTTNIIAAKIEGNIFGLYNSTSRDDANIIVISDQYFLSTLMAGYIGGEYGDYRNFELLSNILLHLSGEEDLAELQEKTNRDTSLYKINDNIELTKKQLYTYLFTFILLPLVISLIGLALWLNQRKKQKLLYSQLF